MKDKTFFFVDYEGQRENVGVVSLGCVPTLLRSALHKPPWERVSPIGTSILNFFPHNAANYIPGTVSTTFRLLQQRALPSLDPITPRLLRRSTI